LIWQPPIVNCIKCNADGASNNIASSCGGIFRNHEAIFLACFAENLGGGTAFHAEMSAVMRAVELANQRGWRNLWIETDSSLVIMAFKSIIALVPCNLRNRWINCNIAEQHELHCHSRQPIC